MTLRDAIRKSVHDADPNLKETDQGFMEQSILLASIHLGAVEADIAEELGYEPEFVNVIGSRLRNAEIWTGDIVNPAHLKAWAEKDKGGIAFLMDSSVGGGDMVLVDRKPGGPHYALTPAGIKRVESLGTR